MKTNFATRLLALGSDTWDTDLLDSIKRATPHLNVGNQGLGNRKGDMISVKDAQVITKALLTDGYHRQDYRGGYTKQGGMTQMFKVDIKKGFSLIRGHSMRNDSPNPGGFIRVQVYEN